MIAVHHLPVEKGEGVGEGEKTKKRDKINIELTRPSATQGIELLVQTSRAMADKVKFNDLVNNGQHF